MFFLLFNLFYNTNLTFGIFVVRRIESFRSVWILLLSAPRYPLNSISQVKRTNKLPVGIRSRYSKTKVCTVKATKAEDIFTQDVCQSHACGTCPKRLSAKVASRTTNLFTRVLLPVYEICIFFLNIVYHGSEMHHILLAFKTFRHS